MEYTPHADYIEIEMGDKLKEKWFGCFLLLLCIAGNLWFFSSSNIDWVLGVPILIGTYFLLRNGIWFLVEPDKKVIINHESIIISNKWWPFTQKYALADVNGFWIQSKMLYSVFSFNASNDCVKTIQFGIEFDKNALETVWDKLCEAGYLPDTEMKVMQSRFGFVFYFVFLFMILTMCGSTYGLILLINGSEEIYWPGVLGCSMLAGVGGALFYLLKVRCGSVFIRHGQITTNNFLGLNKHQYNLNEVKKFTTEVTGGRGAGPGYILCLDIKGKVIRMEDTFYRGFDNMPLFLEIKMGSLNKLEGSAEYYNLGISCYNLHLYQDAISNYSKAIELRPRFTDAYNNRGIVYYFMKQYDPAIADYTKSIQIDPEYSNAYTNRGVVYRDLNQYDQAVVDFTKAIALDPNDISPYYKRGMCYFDLNQYKNSIIDFDKVVALNPNFSLVYSAREYALKELGRADE